MHIFHSWWTALSLLVFIGIWVWAYSARRKTDFQDAAQLPFRGEAGDTSADSSEDRRDG